MARVEYPSDSVYASTPQSSTLLGRFVFRNIAPDTGDRPFTLATRHTNRPDILSFELYGTPNLWWVFSVCNPKLRANPVFGFLAGDTIIVPSAEHVRRSGAS